MLSLEKRTEIITNFFCSYYKLLCCGIEFEEEKCNSTKIFFTYPEFASEDCMTIDCAKFDDGHWNEMLHKLIANSKETGIDAVKKFVVYAVPMAWLHEEDVDDYEVDSWYEDLEESRKMLPIKLYAKMRNGSEWTASNANCRIAAAIEQIDKNIERLKNQLSEYSEI